MAEPGVLQFKDLVREDLILSNVSYEDRDSALKAMASILVEKGYCEEPFAQAILDRERAHPSALPMPGHKIAIPHTDATYVKKSALLFARLREPVEFRSMGDPNETLSVSMISMFALKEKKLIGDLLETLITVYQDESVLNAMYEASEPGDIYRILQKHVEETAKKQ
ncbi:MAG: PTS sugar transporter subunit IIA [Spirochaetaceae bacterium]